MNQEIKYGQFDLIPDDVPADSHMRLVLQPIDLTAFWKRCGLTADFAASFYSYAYNNEKYAENVVSTIVNEMVENAAKFSRARELKVVIDFRHYSSIMRVEVVNHATTSIRNQFEQYIQKLINSEPDELYFKHLESKQENDPHSGLGLLMMMKDYDVKFGFRFQQITEDVHEITVRAHFSLEE